MALRLTNVNDFLTPSATCVLPLQGGATATPIQPPPGSVLSPIIPTSQTAKVSLSDCLTCSGCMTTSETVLLDTHTIQTAKHFLKNDTSHYKVAALSQQAVASLAVKFNLDLATTATKLATFLHTLGFNTIVDLSFARHISLLQAADDFLLRYRAGKHLTVTSACPGWLTYAEKTQTSNVLSVISDVPSAQAIMGSLSTDLLADGRDTWLCSIAPCHDKKIEAHRPEFSANGRMHVNCVITASELADWISEHGFDICAAKQTQLDERVRISNGAFGTNVGSGSDGYADFVLRVAAKELLDVEMPPAKIEMRSMSRSGDLKAVTVKGKDGNELRFATAYGFRSLQTVLRKIRRGECSYHYIELMACPGGCNNGGGQIAPVDDGSGLSVKARSQKLLNNVQNRFDEPSQVEDGFLQGVRDVLNRDDLRALKVDVKTRGDVGPTSLAW